uniref:Putative secreted protein n=1 Tax=Anopheles darlingi TaxID=43151 RepID=A0A2M4DC77_ANODA
MNLPKRELLLLRVVLALPNASRMGFASRIFCSIGPAVALVSHRNLSRYLVLSVLPAPDSPETMIDCDIFSTRMSRIALSAIAYT